MKKMSFDFKNLYKTHYTQGGFLYTLAGLLPESYLSIKPDFLQLPTIPNHFRFVVKSTRSKFPVLGRMPWYEQLSFGSGASSKGPNKKVGSPECAIMQ